LPHVITISDTANRISVRLPDRRISPVAQPNAASIDLTLLSMISARRCPWSRRVSGALPWLLIAVRPPL